MTITTPHANAWILVAEAMARAMAPRRSISVSDWADAHRILSTKGSALAGPWRTASNPPLREPMDCMSARSPVHDIVLKFPIQFGKTEVAVNAVGYSMEINPGPIMVALPGEVSMLKWIAQKLNPMLEETPTVRALLASTASRDGANRREFKDFQGGQLYIEHAGTPSRLKSTSVKILVVDEEDEFAANLTSGDDPGSMIDGRTSAFPGSYKRLRISTPTLKGHSRIDDGFMLGDQRYFEVPCPHCDEYQALEWEGLHWGPNGTGVHYVCQHNGCIIEEHHKEDIIARGRWVPRNPEAKSRSYTINCLYYGFALGPRWATLVEMRLAAQGDPAKLKTFTNDRLARVYEDPAMRSVRPNLIADRALDYPLRMAPEGVLAVTAGVDTQDDRLELQIKGWGRRMAFWVLDYAVLPGDPADEAVWTALVELINRPILHASGALLSVEALAIDAGGHRTEAVKTFVASGRLRRSMAIFGATFNNAPVLSKGKLQDLKGTKAGGKLDRKGLLTFTVGTVAIKQWLYGRLSTDAEKEAPDRLCSFSKELDAAYFRGLVSETFDPRKNRFIKQRGARNEPLDTAVYAYAATHHPELRLHRYTNADWDRRAEALKLAAARERALKGMPPVSPGAAAKQLVVEGQPINKTPAPPVVARKPVVPKSDWSSRL